MMDSIILPFLGSRDEDYITFEYLLLDVDRSRIKIAIPEWVVSREQLKENDLINLHVPFHFTEEMIVEGRIVFTRWDEKIKSQICEAEPVEKSLPPYPIYLFFRGQDICIDLKTFDKVEDLFLKVVKDSMLLKKGISVYWNHLIPYFSRITRYPTKEYPLLKELFLNDIRNKIQEHHRRLVELYDRIRSEPFSTKEIPIWINLEELRSWMESELYMEIFRTTFETKDHLPYLLAIKNLEKRLFFNFNTIVMIYIKSL